MNSSSRRSRLRSRSTVLIIALIAVVAFGLPAGAASSFPAMYGARAMGMGGAFTAVADDATALYWNPAALGTNALTANLSLGFSAAGNLQAFQAIAENPEDLKKLLTTKGEADLGVGLLVGANIGSIGVGYLADGAVHLEKGEGSVFDGDAAVNGNIAVGVARDFAGGGATAIRGGVVLRSVNGMRTFYTVDEHGNDDSGDESGTGYALDIGAQLRLTDAFVIGAAVRNVVGNVNWAGAGAENLPTEFRIGVALTPPLLGGTIAADVASGGQFRYGIEKKLLFGGMKVRFGQIHSDGGSWTTGGVGFALGPVAVETAVIAKGPTLHYTIEAALRF